MIHRRACLGLLAGLPFAASAVAQGEGYSEAAYRRAIVIDAQAVLADPYGAPTDTHLSARAMAEMKASGQTAVSMTVAEVGNALDSWDKSIAGIAAIDQAISDNSDVLLKATSAADILRAKAEGRMAVIFNTQDTALVGPDLDRLAVLKGLGVRVVQLTYNNRNLSGDGCLEPGNGGISRLGRATIARIEQEKLLLDLSHSGQRTVAEALAASTRPCTISHTGCRALNDNPRNQGDAELKACTDKGGVVGIYWMPFLVENSRPTGADLVRHMEHAVQVCGEDHVAIGTDGIIFKTELNAQAREAQRKFFEDRKARGVNAPGEGPDIFNIVEEWDSHMRFLRLAEGLSKAGWKGARIDKVLGGNLMRLYRETWGG
jgi:membrane dipeptidase